MITKLSSFLRRHFNGAFSLTPNQSVASRGASADLLVISTRTQWRVWLSPKQIPRVECVAIATFNRPVAGFDSLGHGQQIHFSQDISLLTTADGYWFDIESACHHGLMEKLREVGADIISYSKLRELEEPTKPDLSKLP